MIEIPMRTMLLNILLYNKEINRKMYCQAYPLLKKECNSTWVDVSDSNLTLTLQGGSHLFVREYLDPYRRTYASIIKWADSIESEFCDREFLDENTNNSLPDEVKEAMYRVFSSDNFKNLK